LHGGQEAHAVALARGHHLDMRASRLMTDLIERGWTLAAFRRRFERFVVGRHRLPRGQGRGQAGLVEADAHRCGLLAVARAQQRLQAVDGLAAGQPRRDGRRQAAAAAACVRSTS
jgi:hypothetical protein